MELEIKFMTNEEILREINSLPIEAKQQIEDFVSFLRERYKNSTLKPSETADLKTEPFVGMWRDREDLSDSSAWVRNVRQMHWSR